MAQRLDRRNGSSVTENAVTQLLVKAGLQALLRGGGGPLRHEVHRCVFVRFVWALAVKDGEGNVELVSFSVEETLRFLRWSMDSYITDVALWDGTSIPRSLETAWSEEAVLFDCVPYSGRPQVMLATRRHEDGCSSGGAWWRATPVLAWRGAWLWRGFQNCTSSYATPGARKLVWTIKWHASLVMNSEYVPS